MGLGLDLTIQVFSAVMLSIFTFSTVKCRTRLIYENIYSHNERMPCLRTIQRYQTLGWAQSLLATIVAEVALIPDNIGGVWHCVSRLLTISPRKSSANASVHDQASIYAASFVQRGATSPLFRICVRLPQMQPDHSQVT